MAEKIKPKNTQTGGGDGGSPFSSLDSSGKDVLVSHGIHSSKFPVAGMSVEAVRKRLSSQLGGIDNGAVAVLDGKDVVSPDKTIIQPGQTLAFIKRAGEKGAAASDSIVIHDSVAEATTAEGRTYQVPLGSLFASLSQNRFDTGGVLPPGVRSIFSRGNSTIWAFERAPHVANFKWIKKDSSRPYGHGTTYRTIQIALPFTVVMATMHGGNLGSCECFFRTQPINSVNDELCYPALLNCSKFAGDPKKHHNPLSWICTQHVNLSKAAQIKGDEHKKRIASFEALLECLFETGFNLSSEHHEGQSWFTESASKIPEISTIEKWEKATAADPLFVLDIPWIPTGYTVKGVAERIFDNAGVVKQTITTSAELARVVFNTKAVKS